MCCYNLYAEQFERKETHDDRRRRALAHHEPDYTAEFVIVSCHEHTANAISSNRKLSNIFWMRNTSRPRIRKNSIFSASTSLSLSLTLSLNAIESERSQSNVMIYSNISVWQAVGALLPTHSLKNREEKKYLP